MNNMITAHKAICNVFVSDKYYKHHYILKSKLYAFQDHNVGLFSGDYTSMAGYFIGMHIDMCMRNHFLPQFLLVNSTLCHSTQNFPK